MNSQEEQSLCVEAETKLSIASGPGATSDVDKPQCSQTLETLETPDRIIGTRPLPAGPVRNPLAVSCGGPSNSFAVQLTSLITQAIEEQHRDSVTKYCADSCEECVANGAHNVILDVEETKNLLPPPPVRLGVVTAPSLPVVPTTCANGNHARSRSASVPGTNVLGSESDGSMAPLQTASMRSPQTWSSSLTTPSLPATPYSMESPFSELLLASADHYCSEPDVLEGIEAEDEERVACEQPWLAKDPFGDYSLGEIETDPTQQATPRTILSAQGGLRTRFRRLSISKKGLGKQRNDETPFGLAGGSSTTQCLEGGTSTIATQKVFLKKLTTGLKRVQPARRASGGGTHTATVSKATSEQRPVVDTNDDEAAVSTYVEYTKEVMASVKWE